MTEFVTRDEQLGVLYRLLAEVARDPGVRPSRVVSVAGPRRVGKSRLVEEFLARAVVPHVYFSWPAGPGGSAARQFLAAGAASTLPGADAFAQAVAELPALGGAGETSTTGWDAVLRLLIAALPTDGPAVVVFDDLFQLIAAVPSFEPALQRAFDQELCGRRVLLIGIGPVPTTGTPQAGTPQAGTMPTGTTPTATAVTTGTTPTATEAAAATTTARSGGGLFQLAGVLAVPVLAPSEIASRLQLAPADAFDAFLITGGLPAVVEEWPSGASIWEHLGEVLRMPTSALLVNAERMLAAEFPTQAQARDVLAVIGSGLRGFADIRRAAGNPPPGSLSRALSTLRDKSLITAELPLSTIKSGETRYRVKDPYLRFWLSFLGPQLPEIERGRGDLVLGRIRAAWSQWRSRAIEPVLREALSRMLTSPQSQSQSQSQSQPQRTVAVGGYWTRSSNPQIDVVIADQGPVASAVIGLGAITWRDDPLDQDDYGRLLTQRSQLPGADRSTPVFAVSRSGSSVPGLRIYSPEELLAAW